MIDREQLRTTAWSYKRDGDQLWNMPDWMLNNASGMSAKEWARVYWMTSNELRRIADQDAEQHITGEGHTRTGDPDTSRQAGDLHKSKPSRLMYARLIRTLDWRPGLSKPQLAAEYQRLYEDRSRKLETVRRRVTDLLQGGYIAKHDMRVFHDGSWHDGFIVEQSGLELADRIFAEGGQE